MSQPNTLIINNTGRYFAAHDVGSFYRMQDGVLEYQPMGNDPHALPLTDEWGAVEEDIVGSEPVIYESQEMTLSELYKIIKSELE